MADVLGLLLRLQQRIGDERDMGEAVARALAEVPGVAAAHLCLRGQVLPPDPSLEALAARYEALFDAPAGGDMAPLAVADGLRALPLRGGDHLFGALILRVADEAAFAPYADLLPGVAQAVAATLETRFYRTLLAHHEQELFQQSNYDRSTGLLTHTAFVEQLAHSIAGAESGHDSGPEASAPRAAIIAITVQHWGRLTESISYRESGEVLQAVADRLRGAVRAGDIVARERGERFYVGVLLNGRGGDMSDDKRDSLQSQISAIADALAPAYLVGGQRRVLRFGIGIALYPVDGDDIEALMLRAEAATHVGADLPRDKLSVFYSASLSERSRRRQAIEDGLIDAAKHDEFCLIYQPKFDARGRRMLGSEALLRWHSPKLGLVMPGEFIPIAEEAGMIAEVGGWAVRAACAQIARWRRDGLSSHPVAVNVSMRQILSPEAVKTVLAAPAEAGIPGELIELEITETAAMQDARATRDFIVELHDRGMTCTLDDFGTGYSSLGYLFDLPFDSLKIDKRFIDRLDSHKGQALVRNIVLMAHDIGLHVVAEGVEQQGQADLLTVWGCDAVQGFLYGRPTEPENLARLF